MKLNIHPAYILLIAASAILSSAVFAATTISQNNNSTSLENPALNPWIEPLNQCASNNGQYHLDMDMGFLNTDYFCRIDPVSYTHLTLPTKRIV